MRRADVHRAGRARRCRQSHTDLRMPGLPVLRGRRDSLLASVARMSVATCGILLALPHAEERRVSDASRSMAENSERAAILRDAAFGGSSG